MYFKTSKYKDFLVTLFPVSTLMTKITMNGVSVKIVGTCFRSPVRSLEHPKRA